MNSIKLSLESSKKMSSVKIPVKVGSNQIYANITKETTCKDLIKSSLHQCKIISNRMGESSKLKSYALFERAAGIESLIRNDQNIFELWLQWKLNANEDNIEFVVKQCRKSKKLANTMIRNNKLSHKIFKIGREKASLETNKNNNCIYEIKTHLYEQIDSEDDDILNENAKRKNVVVKPEQQKSECKDVAITKSKHYLSKILSNEKKLSVQTKKLVKLDASIVRHVKNVKRIINELNSVNANNHVVPSHINLDSFV